MRCAYDDLSIGGRIRIAGQSVQRRAEPNAVPQISRDELSYTQRTTLVHADPRMRKSAGQIQLVLEKEATLTYPSQRIDTASTRHSQGLCDLTRLHKYFP